VGGECIELQVQAVASEKRDAARDHPLSERVDEPIGHDLAAGAELKHRNNLGERVDRQPEPENLVGAAQPGAQFIQLEMWELEMGEEALVQGLCMLPSAGEPGGDGGPLVAEDPLSCGRVEPFGQRREHHGDLVRGSFQTVQGSVAPGSERGTASRTSKRLDVLGMAVLAIANQRMNLSIGNAAVPTLLVGAGIPLGVHSLGGSLPAFHLTPGAYWCTGAKQNTKAAPERG